jgi:hypothetical protein
VEAVEREKGDNMLCSDQDGSESESESDGLGEIREYIKTYQKLVDANESEENDGKASGCEKKRL